MNNSLSYIIRTYNESKYIGKVIEAIRSQERFGDAVEIVVVDSGSNDSTVEIVKKYGIELIEIPQKEFNYSRSLNLGIENSTGDLIAILSAHSVPSTNNWLQAMVTHFEDRTVAGVYCRQIPWPNADLFEVLRIERTFREKSRTFCKKTTNTDMNFSNAASCIRRIVWEKHPFVDIPAAEDMEWARWVVAHGYTIIYEPGVAVYHSHNESCRDSAKRVIELEKAKDISFGNKRNIFVTVRQALGWIFRDVKLIFSQKQFDKKGIICLLKSFGRGFWYIKYFDSKK